MLFFKKKIRIFVCKDVFNIFQFKANDLAEFRTKTNSIRQRIRKADTIAIKSY